MSEFRQYARKQKLSQLRPFVEGEKLPEYVSISQADLLDGCPKVGDMIARNPDDHRDQWLINSTYFADNFEPDPVDNGS